MKNLYLNKNTYDLEVENFNLKFTSDRTEWISQKIENMFKTFEAEWFAEQTLGMPYFQTILKKQANLNEINTLYKTELQNMEDVKEIIKFETEYTESTRTYTINFTVLLTTEEIVSDTIGV